MTHPALNPNDPTKNFHQNQHCLRRLHGHCFQKHETRKSGHETFFCHLKKLSKTSKHGFMPLKTIFMLRAKPNFFDQSTFASNMNQKIFCRRFFILWFFCLPALHLSAQVWYDTLPFFECKKVSDMAAQPRITSAGDIFFEKYGEGVLRFDGIPRFVLGLGKGLPSNNIYLAEDENGRILYNCFFLKKESQRFGFWENGKTIPINAPDSLHRFWLKPDGRLVFCKDENPPKYFSTFNSKEKNFSPAYRMPVRNANFKPFFHFSLAAPDLFLMSDFDPTMRLPSRFFAASPDGKSRELFFPLSQSDLLGAKILGQSPDEAFLIYAGKTGKIFEIKNNRTKLIHQTRQRLADLNNSNTIVPHKIYFLEILDDGKPLKRHCLWQFDKGKLTPFLFRSGEINSFAVASDAQFWFGGTSGIWRMNPAVRVFEPDEKTPENIQSVAEDGTGMFYFSSINAGLARFDGKKMLPAPEFLRPFKLWMMGSCRIGDEVWLPIDGENGIAICQTDGRCDTILRGEIAFFVHRGQKDGSILIGLNRKGMLRCPPNKNPRDRKNWHSVGEKQGWNLFNTLAITQDNFGKTWGCRGATRLGIYDSSADSAYTWVRSDSMKFSSGYCLKTDLKGNIWFGTNRGLRFFHPEKTNFNPQFDLKPIAESFFKDKVVGSVALFGKDSLFVLGEDNRFVLLDLKKFYAQNENENGCITYFPEIRDIDGEIGQNGLFVDSKQNIWLPLTKKLIQFRLENLTPADDSQAGVRFDSLTFSGGSISLAGQKRVKLPDGIRACVFHFSPEFYRPGLYDSIFLTIDNAQVYKGLAQDFRQENFVFATAGRHEIRLASVRNQTLLFEIACEIYMPYPFTEHPAFLPGVSLVFGLLLAGFFYNRKKYYQNLNTQTQARLVLTEQNRAIQETLRGQENLLARLRVSAIVNQLNPHFLKNSLHWMQSRVLDYDEEVADVISHLALSLKNVVESSDGSGLAVHSLRKEFELIENYLTIQKRLFPHRLQFEISGKDLLESLGGLPVPLMSVQIFVENAMIHGIENRATGGQVFVRLRENDQNFEVEVDDNGVGFEEAARIAKEKNKKSSGRGVKMLEELFEILNRQNDGRLFFKTSHKIHPDGSAAGTTVLINFPKNLKYETK